MRSFLPPAGSGARKIAIGFLVLAPLLFGAFGLHLGQDTSIDLKEYHWYNAYALLTGRYKSGIDFMPSGVQFFLSPFLDVPFYMLATALPVKIAYFILGAFQGLNICLLFFLSYLLLPIERTSEKLAVAIITATVGMTGGMSLAEIGASFNDNMVSIGILLSLLIIIACTGAFQSLPYKKVIAIALMAGLPAGLAMGLKLTCSIFCIGLCGGLLFITSEVPRNFIISVFFGLGVMAGLFITYGYWGHYLSTHYQSPVFPFMNQIFKSPFFLPLHLGEARFSPPKGFEFFAFPFMFTVGKKLVTEAPWRDFRVLVWYIFLWLMAIKTFPTSVDPPASAGKKPVQAAAGARNSELIYLLAMTMISYLAWFDFFRIYRYLLVLEMLSPLLILLCLDFIMPSSRKAKILISAAILVFLSLSIQIPPYGRKSNWTDITAVAGVNLASAKNPMILMAGEQSVYAYMLPAFPSSASFVRLEVPGLELLDVKNTIAGKGLYELIQKRINAHTGDFLWFAPQPHNHRKKVLDAFGLKISGTCGKVTDQFFGTAKDIAAQNKNVPDDPDFAAWPVSQIYDLCPVARK